MTTRCDFALSAWTAATVNRPRAKAAMRERAIAIMVSPGFVSGTNKRVAFFRQGENLRDAGFDLFGLWIERYLAARFALDRFHRVHADIELHALRDKAVHIGAVWAVTAQNCDSGPEGHDLDGDLVRAVKFQQVVRDADHESLLLGVIVRELQRQMMLGERFVGC